MILLKFGRWIFTATSSPVGKTAKWTWASDAEAIGETGVIADQPFFGDLVGLAHTIGDHA